MTLPARVKVGPLTYTIKAVADLPDLGLCDDEKATILIRAGLPREVERVVLWHELFHAMMYALGYRKHSERMVDGLAYQLALLLADNKELFK